MTRLIFGCGYLGRRVATRWLEEGHRPVTVTRSASRAEELARQGFEPRIADVTRPETLAGLPAAETVLYAIGYDRSGGLSRDAVQVRGLRAVLDALRHPPARLIYISSTGIYGACDGDWVDEDTPCRPDRESGRMALAAEETLRSHPIGSRAIVLRLAGIYGSGRVPRLRDMVAGRPLPVAPDAIANLIHVDDAASVVLAAEAQIQPPATYVVSDGHPVPRREFYRHLAELLRVPPPEFVLPNLAEGEPPRGAGSKRVRNDRMHQQLRVRLAYPSYREGLAAIVNHDDPR